MGKAIKSVGSALGLSGPAKVAGMGKLKSANVDLKRQFELEKQQNEALQMAKERASGKAPSLAKAQLRAATDRNLSQQLAAARSGRGGNTAATQRNLARSQAQTGQQLAQAGSMQAMQEQQANEATYSNQLSNLRSQDVTARSARANALVGAGSAMAAGQNAANQTSMQQGQNLMNFAGGLMTMSDEKNKKNIKPVEEKETKSSISKDRKKPEAEKDPSIRKRLGKAFLAAANKREEGRAKERAEANAPEKLGKAIRNLASGKKEKVESKDKKTLIQKAGETLTTVSDETKKKNKSQKTDDFLSKLKAYKYEYKDTSMPGTSPGKHTGVMAQDLEKSELGKDFVVDTPNGKMVDYGKGFGAILAAQSHLKEKLDKLEKMKKKAK